MHDYYICPHCGKETDKEEIDALGLCSDRSDILNQELHRGDE